MASAPPLAGGLVWLTAPAGVWSATSPSAPDLDVTADILEATVEIAEYDGRVRLILRNDPSATSGEAGRFSSYGSGSLGALRRGARLRLAAGYYSSLGDEASTGTAYWVESVEQVSGARASLVVQARDAWWLLDRWRARRQFVWAAGSRSISQIIEFLCARAGLDFGAIVPSPSFSALRPAFTVHPGESGRTAVRRLLATVPDEAIMQSGLCIALEPRTSQSVDYTYGTDHAIVAGRYRDEGPDVNRARVFGASDFDEAFDFPEIDSLGERIVQVLDLNLTTTAEVGDRADAALRGVQVRDRGDELLLAGVNCGQELYDVVDLTDAQAGLSAVKRRVLSLS